MVNKLHIREYTISDKETVLNLLRLNTPQYFSQEEENDLLRYLENEIQYYYLLELNGQIIGSGGFNLSDDHSTGRISWDILHPDFQGRSFGGKLLTFRIEKLKKFKNMEHITVRTSQLAFKFYEKYGFRLLETKHDYWAQGFDLYRMEYKK